MTNEEEYKCIVCGRDCQALIGVIAKTDKHNIFMQRRGICQKCLNNTDIEHFCKDFIIKCYSEKIRVVKDELQFLEEELHNLEG